MFVDVSAPTRVPHARELPADWKPNRTHAVIAEGLRLDVVDAAAAFRETRKARSEKRTDWDKAFTAFLRDYDGISSPTWPTA